MGMWRRTTLAAGSVVQSIVMRRRTTQAAGSVVQSIVMRRRTTLAAGSVVQSIVMMRRTTLAAGSVVQTIVLLMIAVIGSVVRLAKSVRIILILPNVKNARVEIDTNFTDK